MIFRCIRPVRLRPVNGVAVSLDGRHSIDYYSDSVTIGVSLRRSSHVSCERNVRDGRRCVIHALPSPSSESGLEGNLFKRRAGFLLSLSRRWYSTGFPTERVRHPWALTFTQSSVHHNRRFSRSRLGMFARLASSRFPHRLCVLFRFPVQVSGVNQWVFLVAHPFRSESEIPFAVTWRNRPS
jgi:hypothetical protein